ncbi:phage tail protein [Riemerella anatipestifer]|uniref:tape measure protein n=1 Tax=Riemerella anatipestifer TaxID=34085 RepID=UPI00129E6386|nr:tape measure protein [Riemerella anatipestifer]MRM93785.1 phage tail protein [Riemerella anatipestifer]WPC13016.1 tape measure protein [Riemerella anatipestifer]
MNTNNGGLFFGAAIDMTQWRKDLREIQADILGLNQKTQEQTRQMDTSFKNLSIGIAGYFSGQALMGFTRELINVRGEFQKTEIAFSTMLKSKEKANELMGQMVDLAAKTPFGLNDVTEGAKRLLAFQVPAEQVTETLTRMGNVAAGLGVPMGQLIHVYGQVKAQGKMMTNDLYQFMNAGIPILSELGKVLGKSEAEIKDMVSAGKIGFPEVQAVIKNMTDEGGLFFNLMEEQSKTLSGKVANLEDAFDQMLNKIGESSEGLLNSGIEGATYLMEHYEEVGSVILGLITTYGSYKAGLILIAQMERIYAMAKVQQSLAIMAGETGITTARALQIVVTMQLQRAQAMLNATMLANPYVLAGAAIIGLIATLWSLSDSTDAATRAQEKLNEEQKKEKEISEEKKRRTHDLIGVIRDKTQAILEQVKALQQLKAEYPELFANMTLEEIQNTNLEDLQKRVNNAESQRQQKANKEKIKSLDEEIKKYEEIYNSIANSGGANISTLNDYLNRINELKAQKDQLTQQTKEEEEALWRQNTPLEEQKKHWERVVAKAKKQKEELEKQATPIANNTKGIEGMQTPLGTVSSMLQKMTFQWISINGLLSKATDELKKIENLQSKDKPKDKSLFTYEDWETQKNNAEENRKKYAPNSKEWLQAKRDYDEATKALKKWSFEQDKGKTTYSKGQVGWLDQEINRLNELIKKSKEGSIQYRKLVVERKKLEERRDRLNGKYDNAPIKGSLGYLEKELSDIREKIKNKTNVNDEKHLKELYNKEKELVDKIEKYKEKYKTKNVEEELSELKRRINLRDKYLQIGMNRPELINEDTVNNLFPDLKDKSYVQVLEEKRKAYLGLIEAQKATEQTTIDLIFIENELKNANGTETFMQGVNDRISELKEKYKGAELIDKLKKAKSLQLGGTEEDNLERNKAYASALKEAQKDYDKFYRDLLEQQKTYEEKSLELQKEYTALKATERYKNATPEEQKKIDKHYKKEQSKLDMDAFKESGDWALAFSDLEYMSQSTIERVIKNFEDFKRAKEQNLEPTELRELNDTLNKLRAKAGNNPFTGIISGVKGYVQANKDAKTAQDEYNATVDKFGKNSPQAQEAYRKMTDAEQEAIKAKQLLNAQLQKGQDIFNATIQGVTELADAFGGMDDATKDAIEDITAVGNAAFDLAKSISSGNIAGMITAGVKLIGSIIKALNGDKKRERNIKRWAQALEEVKEQYRALEHQISKTLGENVYKEQGKIIANLRQQQQMLQRMANEEASKKKSDSGKIAEYRNQAKEIDRQITDIIDKMKNDIAQTDAKSLADKLGDALFEAWQRGEDGAKAYEKTVDDVMRNAAKAALKQKLLEGPMQEMIDNLVKKMGFGGGDASIEAEIKEKEDRLKKIQNEIKNGNIVQKAIYAAESMVLKGQIEKLKKQYEDSKNINPNGSFDGLTPSEREEIKNQGKVAMNNYMEALKQYQDLFGAAEENADSMKGAIKGMSEETASVWVGQFHAVRIHVAEIQKNQGFGLDIAKSSLMNLMKIEENTRNLYQMRKDLSEMNAKIKSNDTRGLGL